MQWVNMRMLTKRMLLRPVSGDCHRQAYPTSRSVEPQVALLRSATTASVMRTVLGCYCASPALCATPICSSALAAPVVTADGGGGPPARHTLWPWPLSAHGPPGRWTGEPTSTHLQLLSTAQTALAKVTAHWAARKKCVRSRALHACRCFYNFLASSRKNAAEVWSVSVAHTGCCTQALCINAANCHRDFFGHQRQCIC